MTDKRRRIALLLVVALSILYGTLVSLSARQNAVHMFDGIWQHVAGLVTGLSEPAALALGGCVWLVIGVAVGLVGHGSASAPTTQEMPPLELPSRRPARRPPASAPQRASANEAAELAETPSESGA